ncbi:hypothetical protein I6G56_24975 [Burkholderia humptydooensis]|uniref:Uncharacterized protein n=2 Tax=Burkholderia humptydooensis TaxID=430531 RepID=A0A7T2U8K0_9BURK|nr:MULTISPECIES: hypothetical protein [Burkholderia]EIP87185.1 hypothetical protein A33K_16789 [Burkholderia humptydooensis MSMB43]QPS47657.1 hypothetical protein I6G56_24975 [Burkholderia humptydooensis]
MKMQTGHWNTERRAGFNAATNFLKNSTVRDRRMGGRARRRRCARRRASFAYLAAAGIDS